MKIDPAIWWGVGLGGAALVALAVAQGKINLGGKTSQVGTGETGGVEVKPPTRPSPDPYPVKPLPIPLPIGRPVIVDTKNTGTTVIADPAVSAPSSTAPKAAGQTSDSEREIARRWRQTLAEATAGNYQNALRAWDVGTARGTRPNANTKQATGAVLCGLFRDGMGLAYPDVEQCNRTGGVDCDSLRDDASAQVRAAIEQANRFIDANNLRNDPEFLKGLQSCSSTNLCAEYQPSPVWAGLPPDVEAARREEHERLRTALGCQGAKQTTSGSASTAREFRATTPRLRLPFDPVVEIGRPGLLEL